MKTAIQFSKYGGVAVGSAVADYVTFAMLLFFGAGVIPAQMVARIAGGVFSFFSNKYWSFRTKDFGCVKTEGRRFIILYAFSYVLALSMLYGLTEWAGMSAYASKIAADVTCFVVNFIVMRSYVFSSRIGLSQLFRIARPSFRKSS